jgi:transcriptional regulator with XRE-family HTH domain
LIVPQQAGKLVREMERAPTTRLRELRLRDRDSLRRLAIKIGIGYRHLFDLEHGSAGWPKARKRLAEHFGVPESELFKVTR